jgi:hypothetical protein
MVNTQQNDTGWQDSAHRKQGSGSGASRALRAPWFCPPQSARRAARAGTLTLMVCLLPSCATVPSPPPRRPTAVPAVEDVGSWPRPEVLDLAIHAYQCGRHEGRFDRPVLTVIDYSLPSSEPRLWVIDLLRRQVLHHELVAHGEGSGGTVPATFSNEQNSHQSSLGLFRTDEVYVGRFGYSLRLSGLEPGINDKARERAIVVHGYADVNYARATAWGAIGRTWGCPAVPVEAAPRIIDSIAGGSAIFAYYPDEKWLRESHFLHCSAQLAGVTAGH